METQNQSQTSLNISHMHPNSHPQQSQQQQHQQQPPQTQQQTQQQSQEESHTPRDVRLLRLIFASQGVAAYEDHVPLQLMDFAYRYTSQILQDAMVYNDYAHPTHSNAGNIGGGPGESSNNQQSFNQNQSSTNNVNDNDDISNKQLLNNEDIRLAIAARTSYQFKPVPPKKMLMELAAERNDKPLPAVMPMWGVRLPPEKYCLTAKDDYEEKRRKI